tara:strand:+ start:53 stop:442 length:390 start_codon:yes stop_codon:yes gene_type:complete
MNREDLQEIEDLVADLPEWEQDARRIVYRYTYNRGNFHSVYTFLATKVPSWEPASDEVQELRIADYYRFMQPLAEQDNRRGTYESFAILFIRAVNDSLYGVSGINVHGSLKNLLDQVEQEMKDDTQAYI